MAASAPASSPRLPSPPPIAEDQIGPTSPGVSLFEDHGQFPSINSIDTGAGRRIRPGTKSEDMAEGPPLVELAEVCHHYIGHELARANTSSDRSIQPSNSPNTSNHYTGTTHIHLTPRPSSQSLQTSPSSYVPLRKIHRKISGSTNCAASSYKRQMRS